MVVIDTVCCFFFSRLFKVINVSTVFWGYTLFVTFLVTANVPQLFFNILLRLNKKNSFLGRYMLWKELISWIKKKALFGYGYLSGNSFLAYTNRWWATHAHNWALNIMMIGGVVLFIIFILGVLFSASGLDKHSGNICSMIISATIITFFMMGIDESMTNSPMIYPIFILAMNIDRIVELYREEKNMSPLLRFRYSFTVIPRVFHLVIR